MISKFLKIVLLFVFLLNPLSGRSEFVKKEAEYDLEKILEKCAEYCERLDNIALYFVCEEKITEVINNSPSSRLTSTGAGITRMQLNASGRVSSPHERNIYVYDYQLKRFGGVIDEQRILLKQKGISTYIKNALLKTKRFFHKYIIFGPIGLLGRKQQEKYEYTKLKDVKYKGNQAVILEATPKFPEAFDALYGKIWIGKEDFSILKIEWNPKSMGNYEGIEQTAKEFKAKPKIVFVSEFGFEKNKIRFPNKYYVEEIYIFSRGQRFTLSKTTVIYDNYKFFTVETDIKY